MNSAQVIHVDDSKIKAIREAFTHFHLTSLKFPWSSFFCQEVCQEFYTIVAPMTEVLQAKRFEWTKQAQMAFEEIKLKLTSVAILSLPSFSKVFEVECNAFGVKIGVVLSHKKKFIAFFSEKLTDTKRRYSTYNKKFYAVRASEH